MLPKHKLSIGEVVLNYYIFYQSTGCPEERWC